MASLQLFLLGAPRVVRDAVPVDLHRRRAVALLAYLAVSGEAHTRDSLAALLWPELDAARARADLRRTLSTLGREIGEGVIAAGRESVALAPESGLWVDVAEFRGALAACREHGHPERETCDRCLEPLERAASLYRGDLLAGFSLRDSPAFDEWQFFEADSLKREAVAGVERLARGLAERGELDAAIAHARHLLALDRGREATHRELMRLYAATDQRAAALRQYRECVRILEEEFGEPPAPETASLYESIRTGASRPERPALARSETIARVEPPSPVRPRALPSSATPFLGRETELAELAERLANPECRLLTLVGPGGIGKTRLAVELASSLAPSFADGVCFVPLAAVASPELLPQAVADALGAPPCESADPRKPLLKALSSRSSLVVLDNFDRLLDGADMLVEALEHAGGVKLIVTSRERLNLRGEWAFEVGGLPFPLADVECDCGEFGAVRLFLQSAERARGGSPLPAEDLPHVARICRLVEGLPLAIELAAAWVRVLACDEIAREIEACVGFLEASLRDLPERHRNIRAVFDPSWQRLSDREKRAFRALAVFRGGFLRDAAERVAGASIATLSSLADKSLVRRGASGRFELHELLRQYAAEKLDDEPEEADRVHARHAEFFVDFVGARADALDESALAAFDEIGRDIENVRAAWRWSVSAGRFDLVDRALDAAFRFYDLRGWFEEGERVFGGAAEAAAKRGPAERRTLGRLLVRQGAFLFHLGHYDRARRTLERGVGVLQELGDREEAALAVNRLGAIYHQVGAHDEARRLLGEALDLYRETNDRMGIARALGGLGVVAGELREYEEAQRLLGESLAINRETGRQKKIATSLNDLGYIVYLLGDYERAGELLEESLAIRRALDHRKGIAVTLDNLAYVAEAVGDDARAEALFREALAIADEIHAVPVALDVLVGLGCLLAKRDDPRAVEIVEVGLLHPSAWRETRETASRLLARIAPGAVFVRAPRVSLERAISDARELFERSDAATA